MGNQLGLQLTVCLTRVYGFIQLSRSLYLTLRMNVLYLTQVKDVIEDGEYVAANSNPRLGRASEDYLKAIFKLQEDGDGATVSTSQLAQRLGVSPAAVTKAVQQLARKKLATYKPYHGVRLSAAGRATALETIRHHRLLEVFLHDILGYRWDEVDAEAERLEHHISEEFEARMDRLLNYPKFDPHGAPIPSPDGEMCGPTGCALATFDGMGPVVVLRVSDRDPELLQYLAGFGLRPGVRMEIVERQPFNGPLTVRIGGVQRALGREVAACIFVGAASEAGDSDHEAQFGGDAARSETRT